MPATALAVTTAGRSKPSAAVKDVKSGLQYRTIGKTGLKLTTVSFGCLATSDPTVITRAADMGIVHFYTARVYQGGNNERMVILSSKSLASNKAGALADLESSLKELGTDHLDIWYLHSTCRPQDSTGDLRGDTSVWPLPHFAGR